MADGETGSCRALMMILVIPGVIIVLSTLYSFRTSETISAEYAPLLHAAMALEIEVARSRIVFDETLQSRDTPSTDKIAPHLAKAELLVTAILEGGAGALDDAILPLKEPYLRQLVSKVGRDLLTMRAIMQERLAAPEGNNDRQPIEATVGRLVANMVAQTTTLKQRLQEELNRERRWQRLSQIVIMSLTVVLLGGMIVAFRRFERRERESRQELERLATRDSLTGVLNRRSFDALLEDEWQHATRSRTPLSLILCDIDQFKRYNDTLGHQEGDACLREVAHILQTGLHRPTDRLSRYGGEEFAIVLPFCDQEGAAKVMERIHRILEEEAIPHPASEVADRVTVSAGIATITPDGRCASPAELLAVADRELYRAKREGRNRTYASEIHV